MPRNMSFSKTTDQIRARTKTVTRRDAFSWNKLKPGDTFMAVAKGMGLKKGEKVEQLGLLRCVSNRVERLSDITQEECVKEGFFDMTPAEFIAMFMKLAKMTSKYQSVRRIEFEYVEDTEQ